MLEVYKLTLGQLNTNCYILYSKVSKHCVIIDPADEASLIYEKIYLLNLKPKLIVATHGHFDHIQAAAELKLFYKIPFYLHKKDLFLLRHFRKSAIRFTQIDPGPAPEVDAYLDKKIAFGEIELSVIETPGHTPGSVSFYSKRAGIIFAGDLLFYGGGVGRYDFSYCDKNKLFRSIRKVLKLPKETLIYPGHGEETNVEFEQVCHKHGLLRDITEG